MTRRDVFGDPDDGQLSRAATRTAHLLPVALLAVFPACLVADLVPGAVPGWLSATVAVIAATVLLVTICHQDLARLCLRCMSEIATDPGREVARWRPLLRWSHRGPIASLLPVVLSLLAALAASVLDSAGVGTTPRWLWVPMDFAWAGWAWSVWVHHRLRPWCPYCRRWDGGGAREPSPDPVRDGVRS